MSRAAMRHEKASTAERISAGENGTSGDRSDFRLVPGSWFAASALRAALPPAVVCVAKGQGALGSSASLKRFHDESSVDIHGKTSWAVLDGLQRFGKVGVLHQASQKRADDRGGIRKKV